jgi:hypothetical protein
MTMNKKTLKALHGSIKKWKSIVDGSGEDRGAKNCPLCRLFLNENECKGCPVFERTGYACCDETPFREWSEYISSSMENKVFDEESKRLAQNELDFLKSLLPKKQNNERNVKNV